MKAKLVGLGFGAAFGFVLAWARLTDPQIIRRMLLLQEADVFLIMGSAVLVSAVGVRLLRAVGARALVTGELVTWSIERPSASHVAGSALFGAGWSVAGTCPGPVASMIGEGRLGGIVLVGGLLAGVVLQGVVAKKRIFAPHAVELPGTAGL
jgi:uncharacterized membrane protein YedE/YeeE